MEVKIGGNLFRLGKPFAEGGEARVYKIDDRTAAKIYKLPVDPDIKGDQPALAAARIRLVVAQRKLPFVPRDMPASIVAPCALVRDPGSGFVIGFTMPLVKTRSTLADLRVASPNLSDRDVIGVFSELRSALRMLHARGIVLGDFNDRNILIAENGSPRIIDIDSAQFAPFRTKVFTPEFVDPDLCRVDPSTGALDLATEHTPASDWYAWWVMLFQALYGIHPYGGIYKPADKNRKIPPSQRALKEYRVTVYHPEVVCPKNARPLREIPELIAKYFRMVFVDGLRMEPPESMFASLAFDAAGRFDTPACVERIRERSSAAAKQFSLATIAEADRLVACDEHEGLMKYLTLKASTLYRDQAALSGMASTDGVFFALAGNQSVIAKETQAIVIGETWPNKVIAEFKTSSLAGVPLITGSSNGLVFYDGMFKLLTGARKPFVRILDVDSGIEPLRLFAAGEYLAILYARAGKLGYLVHHLAWDTTLCDVAYAYVLPNQIERVESLITAERAWLFITTSTQMCCTIVDVGARAIVTHLEVSRSNIPVWMNSPERLCAMGRYLFCPAVDGISRIDIASDGTADVKTFAIAESLAQASLHACQKTLYAAFDNRLAEIR